MSGLRFMSYNVRYFGQSTYGLLSTAAAMRNVAVQVASMLPLCDVICLQEVESHSIRSRLVTSRRRHQLPAFMRELDHAMTLGQCPWRYRSYYFPAHRYSLSQHMALYTTGLAVLLSPRVQLPQQVPRRGFDVTHRRGYKRLKQTRICAHLKLQFAGRQLDLFNTHLSLPGPFYAAFWKEPRRLGYGPNQLLEARRLLDFVRQSGTSPKVLLGDFNALPGSPVDRCIQQRGGLVDALARARGLGLPQRLAWATAGFRGMRMAIDRIYASPELEWLDFDGSAPFGRNRFSGLSDHVPLLGRLRCV